MTFTITGHRPALVSRLLGSDNNRAEENSAGTAVRDKRIYQTKLVFCKIKYQPESRRQEELLELFGRTGAVSLNKKVLFSLWEQWLHEGSADELRSEAVERLKDCVNNKKDTVDLSGLGLRSLPEYLSLGIIVLNASRNRLSELPRLPQTLRQLDVRSNLLSELPRLPQRLDCLDVSDNRLRALPCLPQTLTHLDASHNLLAVAPMPHRNYRVIGLRDNANIDPASLETLRQGVHRDCQIGIGDGDPERRLGASSRFSEAGLSDLPTYAEAEGLRDLPTYEAAIEQPSLPPAHTGPINSRS